MENLWQYTNKENPSSLIVLLEAMMMSCAVYAKREDM